MVTCNGVSVEDITITPELDVNGRNIGKTVSVSGSKIAEEQIAYLKFGDRATLLPSTVRYGNNVNGRYVVRDSVKYRYDVMGNIVEVLENGLSVAKYEYDALGRLKREDNKHFAKTTLFSYDDNGNILTKYEYAFTNVDTAELNTVEPTRTVLYGYDEDSDRVLTIDDSAKETVEIFEYDEIGNPTTYRGKSATWSCGREMTGFDGNTFAYDARGRRVSKNGITFTYDSNGKLIKQSNGLEFIYDHTGLLAVEYNGSRYFYRKNVQNDIIALLDNDGNIVVKYVYDAWGVCDTIVLDENAANIANLNPFRYRSYYLDTGLNLYYLKTRYYDPEICRFITIDDIPYLAPDTINGLNLYAYCKNNPVMYLDETGCFAKGLLFQFAVSALCYVGFSIAAIWDKEIAADMQLLVPSSVPKTGNKFIDFVHTLPNPFNTDESLITTRDLKGNIRKVSFYKGVPVIRFNSKYFSSFSFGAIFLNNQQSINKDVLNHEYGHNIQQMIIGPQKYFFGIAIPSILTNVFFEVEKIIKGSYHPNVNQIYFSMPWERTAELFGGAVNSSYYKNSKEISLIYLALLTFI